MLSVKLTDEAGNKKAEKVKLKLKRYEMEALAQDQIELEAKMTAQLRERMAEIPDRDLPGALRNVAVAKGINVDKTAPIRGEPTQIVGTPIERAQQALAVLGSKGLLIEGRRSRSRSRRSPEPCAHSERRMPNSPNAQEGANLTARKEHGIRPRSKTKGRGSHREGGRVRRGSRQGRGRAGAAK